MNLIYVNSYFDPLVDHVLRHSSSYGCCVGLWNVRKYGDTDEMIFIVTDTIMQMAIYYDLCLI